MLGVRYSDRLRFFYDFLVFASNSSSWKGKEEGEEKGIEKRRLVCYPDCASAHPNSAF